MGNSSTKIFLIRHGVTISNIEGRFRGRTDIPLSDKGITQANQLAEALKRIRFEAIYSSPLPRAVQTAEPLAARKNLDVVLHQGFTNFDLGDWTGMLKTDVQHRFPELWQQWISNPERIQIPGAETIDDVRIRAYSAIESLAEKHDGRAFAVVTHRAVLKPLIAQLLGIAEPYFWKLDLHTAGYSVFEKVNDGYILKHFNVIHHLTDYVEEIF